MKRLLLLLLNLLVVPLAFFGGIAFSYYRLERAPDPAIAMMEQDIRDARMTVCKRDPYADESIAPDGQPWDIFDPSEDDNLLKLSYVGGLRDIRENSLELSGDGELHVSVDGKRRLVRTLAVEETRRIFLDVLQGGITEYSDGVVMMKQGLKSPSALKYTTCGANTCIEIRVPKYQIDFKHSCYQPENDASNYPDIIEFKQILDFEKQIRSLVPDETNIWE